MKNFFTYILLCSNGSYYVGHTSNIENRLKTHNSGKGSTHTAKYLPVKLLYFEELKTETEAVKMEMQLKGWTRKKKESLINGEMTQNTRRKSKIYKRRMP